MFKATHNMGIKIQERGGKRSDREVRSNHLGNKDCG
jgi:hypothetical protein